MMTASYSPEDNKLRLYSVGRLGSETYSQVKAAGFKWAPKQELFVAPAWSPAREDLLLELCEEIGDEDYSPEERAADRAERFSDYRDNRRDEAGSHADRFEAGPAAFGHQNRARAERQAERHDRHGGRACSQWSKAEYWQTRTAAVIAHALYKSSAAVRRGRILRLEAEQRKHEKTREEYATRFRLWSAVPKLEGADKAGETADRPGFVGIAADSSPAFRAAYALANSSGCWGDYTHPRAGGDKRSLYSLLTLSEDPITPAEAAALWLNGAADPTDEDSHSARWSAHYAMRLGYEKAMLAEEGGSAAEADMEPGGWIGKHQIHGVNRSPVTKRVVSVKLMMEERWYRGEGVTRPDGSFGTPLTLQSFNVERLPEGAYRAPTDEEREAFQTATEERKTEEKAKKPATPPLVNPTDEDAQKLQDLWNEKAKALHVAGKRYGDCPVSEVLKLTQAQYSARSKGAYASFETVDVNEKGERRRLHGGSGRVTVFKVRRASAGGSNFSAADRVIVLTDKPQKPIPWDALYAAGALQPTEGSVFPTLGRVQELLRAFDSEGTEEGRKLIGDARYVGWVWSASMTQKGFTEAGIEALRHFEAEQAAEACYS